MGLVIPGTYGVECRAGIHVLLRAQRLISKARQTLPPPDDGQPAEQQAEIDVLSLGPVRIEFRFVYHFSLFT